MLHTGLHQPSHEIWNVAPSLKISAPDCAHPPLNAAMELLDSMSTISMTLPQKLPRRSSHTLSRVLASYWFDQQLVGFNEPTTSPFSKSCCLPLIFDQVRLPETAAVRGIINTSV